MLQNHQYHHIVKMTRQLITSSNNWDKYHIANNELRFRHRHTEICTRSQKVC